MVVVVLGRIAVKLVTAAWLAYVGFWREAAAAIGRQLRAAAKQIPGRWILKTQSGLLAGPRMAQDAVAGGEGNSGGAPRSRTDSDTGFGLVAAATEAAAPRSGNPLDSTTT